MRRLRYNVTDAATCCVFHNSQPHTLNQHYCNFMLNILCEIKWFFAHFLTQCWIQDSATDTRRRPMTPQLLTLIRAASPQLCSGQGGVKTGPVTLYSKLIGEIISNNKECQLIFRIIWRVWIKILKVFVACWFQLSLSEAELFNTRMVQDC